MTADDGELDFSRTDVEKKMTAARRRPPGGMEDLDKKVGHTLDIAETRVESHALEDELAEEHARQLLKDEIEQLYDDALDVNNPPESFAAFEDRVALRRLKGAAVKFGSYITDPARANETIELVIDVGHLADHEADLDTLAEAVDHKGVPRNAAGARKTIDRMASYGAPAEQFLAEIAYTDWVHPDVAEYALDTLADLEDSDDEPAGFWDAVTSLFGGDG
jgi:hypothetical protein